jgi:hypothetical protein
MNPFTQAGKHLTPQQAKTFNRIKELEGIRDRYTRLAQQYQNGIEALQHVCQHEIVSTEPDINGLIAQQARWQKWHDANPDYDYFDPKDRRMLDLRVWSFGSAYCKICLRGTIFDYKEFGWYCPNSPKKYCTYDGGDSDRCDWCGLPEERK